MVLGEQLVLQLEDGVRLSSANEICRFLCMGSLGGGRAFAGGGGGQSGDLARGAMVDYWLEWEGRELKVKGGREGIS